MRHPDTALQRLFMCPSPEIFYLPITKSGSTFVKNVLWAIEHGAPNPDPSRIHRDNGLFLRASQGGITLDQVRQSETAFVVLRDPVSRFLSLYFDKVIGPGAQRFAPLRRSLIKEYGLKPTPADNTGHRWNTHALATFIADNLRGNTDLRRNPHWRPQSARSKVMAAGNLKIVLADEMDDQLHHMLGPVVPEIGKILATAERNPSQPKADRGDVLASEALQLIESVYDQDARTHCVAGDIWRSSGRIPRYSEVRSLSS